MKRSRKKKASLSFDLQTWQMLSAKERELISFPELHMEKASYPLPLKDALSLVEVDPSSVDLDKITIVDHGNGPCVEVPGMIDLFRFKN